MTEPVHSIWLMPSAPDRERLSEIVSRLSQRFATPCFAPHLTIRGDATVPMQALAQAIREAAGTTAPFAQPVLRIDTSDAYFRSFYAAFAIGPVLAALKRQLDGDGAEAFMPHVSLLYGPVEAGLKAQAALEIGRELDGRAIAFDRLCVVTSGQEIAIADWRVVAEARLGG